MQCFLLYFYKLLLRRWPAGLTPLGDTPTIEVSVCLTKPFLQSFRNRIAHPIGNGKKNIRFFYKKKG